MKNLYFINKQADKCFKRLPEKIQVRFQNDLNAILQDKDPYSSIEHLNDTVGKGAIELKINGSPAHRCIYCAKHQNHLVVLHSFTKTTNGPATKDLKIARKRYKEMITELRIK